MRIAALHEDGIQPHSSVLHDTQKDSPAMYRYLELIGTTILFVIVIHLSPPQ